VPGLYLCEGGYRNKLIEDGSDGISIENGVTYSMNVLAIIDNMQREYRGVITKNRTN
jgi:hypothetical protein